MGTRLRSKLKKNTIYGTANPTAKTHFNSITAC